MPHALPSVSPAALPAPQALPPAKAAAVFLAAGLLCLACWGCVPQQPTAPPPPAQAAPQPSVAVVGELTAPGGERLSGYDIRNKKPFSTSYRALLRRNGLKSPWLLRFEGPAGRDTPVRLVRIGGAQYMHFVFCREKSGDQIEVLFCETDRSIYGRLRQHGEARWLDDPPLEISQALELLWKLEPPL
ncbi:hypothetical protein [Humidesulfovibrio sp.]